MLGSRFWYKSNSHNVCHGLWGYSEGHPLVYCRIPNSLTCKSSSASPIATAWWGTKRLFQLQWQPPPTRLTFFWQTREHKEQTSLQMDVLIYHFYGGNPLEMTFGWVVQPRAFFTEVVLWRPCLCDLGGAVSHWSVQTNQVRTDSQHYQGGQGARKKQHKNIPRSQPTQTQQRIRNAEEFYF